MGCFGKCSYHAHVADCSGSNWAKWTPICQRTVLPTIINFPMDLMTFRPKTFLFSLKVLKGFTSSNVNYQATDYFSSSALYQWNNPTLNVSQYYHFSKENGRFVGGNKGSSPLLLYYKHHYFTSNFFKCSHNKISTHQTNIGLINQARWRCTVALNFRIDSNKHNKNETNNNAKVGIRDIREYTQFTVGIHISKWRKVFTVNARIWFNLGQQKVRLYDTRD